MAPLVAERMTADTDHVAATLNLRLLALGAWLLRERRAGYVACGGQVELTAESEQVRAPRQLLTLDTYVSRAASTPQHSAHARELQLQLQFTRV